MALDTFVARLLAANGDALRFPPGARSDPGAAARYLAAVRPRLNTPSGATASGPALQVHDEVAAGGRAVRVYSTGAGAADRPIVLYLHGGGWVSGGLEMNDGLCRRLAASADAVVVSVDYRLAPEHPYPAALADTLAASAWAAENARRLGGTAERMVLAGTSAGGNLAAAACLRMRDAGLPAPVLQVLMYPVLDLPRDSASYLANGSGYLLEREQMEWYWDSYLPGRGPHPPADAAPARCSDLHGLAPALVVAAEYDPLRDEADAYAHALRAAEVPVEVVRCDGMIHGFLSFLDAVPAAADAADRIASAIARAGSHGV